MNKLLEDSRRELISKSKSSHKGRQRFNRRVKSRVASSVREFNSINMNKLFKDDILTVNIKVNGETKDYLVRISFSGFLEILRDQIDRFGNLDLRSILRALTIGFNKDDVYISCSCPDFYYRFGYWTTRNDTNSGAPQSIPSDITNPNDSLGSGCKHILLVLNNTSWLIKVASVINNYIHYMEAHYERAYSEIIYPAIYGKPYDRDVQLRMDDPDNLATDADTDELDKSNEYGRTRTQFKKGNEEGIRFASKEIDDEDQQALNFDDE